MFRIKICGITNVEDAVAAVDAGADAVGLNFYNGSPRCIGIPMAQEISRNLAPEVTRVGVFVNASSEEIRGICDAAEIQWVQLHGDEPPKFLGLLNNRYRIIRARRIESGGSEQIVADIQACCAAAGRGPDAILVDAAVAGQFGGTGATLPWKNLTSHQEWSGSYPFVLAGGLTPDNIAEAIRLVRPHAVDVASGVERSPGRKDHGKIRDFVAAAREAFARIE